MLTAKNTTSSSMTTVAASVSRVPVAMRTAAATVVTTTATAGVPRPSPDSTHLVRPSTEGSSRSRAMP